MVGLWQIFGRKPCPRKQINNTDHAFSYFDFDLYFSMFIFHIDFNIFNNILETFNNTLEIRSPYYTLHRTLLHLIHR